MKKFKSESEKFWERMEAEGRVTKLSAEETFEMITAFNRERAKAEPGIRAKEIAAWRELKDIIIS